MITLLPIFVLTVVRWQDANQRLDAAVAVQSRGDRLDGLLQLTPALGDEALSALWSAGGQEILGSVDAAGAERLLPDFAATEVEDRERVDALVEQLDLPDVRTAIDRVRRDSELGLIEYFSYEDRYDAIMSDVQAAAVEELQSLRTEALRAGTTEVIEAARVAEAAARLQLVSSRAEMRWAQLRAGSLFPPVLGDVTQFARQVAVFDERSETLTRVAFTGTPVAAQWLSLRGSPTAVAVRQNYGDTVDKFASSGVDATRARNDTLVGADLSFVEILSTAAAISEGLEDADEYSAGLGELVNLALVEVDRLALEVVDSAQASRLAVAVQGMSLAGLIFALGLALLVAVGRPVRAMAHSAQRLSLGMLDSPVRESGPTEIRLAARALNEAIESVRLAESQAVALAEERLDDAVLEHRAPGALSASLQTAVGRLTDSITEREEFQSKLEYEATHDHLTKLANRSEVLRRLSQGLERASRDGGTVALLYLDIDHFKSINDTHGHHVGDGVLSQIADRLRASIGAHAVPGRIGGDEFVVILDPVADLQGAVDTGEAVLNAIGEPMLVEDITFRIGASLGVGLANSPSTVDASTLLRDADGALYRAKQRGKGRVEVCDDAMRRRIVERQALEEDIRSAIAENQLVLHFQPIVSANGGALFGVEALVRWLKPSGELVYPDQFIPAAERTDLVLELDRWVLNAALQQGADWASQSVSVVVGINISARHLGSGTLLDDVTEAATQSGFDLRSVVLEVTETAVLEDLEIAASELQALRDLGVRIALDDYGTGFMSLTHLRKLPIDILKIDRTFVQQLAEGVDSANSSLLRLIVDTGQVLGLEVIGEGVEDESEAAALRALGVQQLQGYFFGKPQPADSVVTLAAPTLAA